MRILEDYLLQAEQLGASDLHLSAGARPVARVQGQLQALEQLLLSKSEVQQLVQQSLPPNLQTQLEKTGEVDCAETIAGIRCRLNIYTQTNGYALAVRLLAANLPNCEELGLPSVVQNLQQLKQGLVLVTGATGSGKSTTLAALMESINRTRQVHLLTLEDPIEYIYQPQRALINQREVGRDTHSFASGLRSALREDPDIILVGELRDAETIGIALTAAETGHLVFATLHTRDAVSSVNRILDILPDKQLARLQLADVLQAVVCQTLLPKCGGGRVPAFEVLLATEALRVLIRDGRTEQLQTYLQTGKRYGMVTMQEYIKNLRQKGLIE